MRVVIGMQGKSITFIACGPFFNDCTANVAIQVCCFFCLGCYIQGAIASNRRGLILVHNSCCRLFMMKISAKRDKIFVVSVICNFLHRDRSNECVELYIVIFFLCLCDSQTERVPFHQRGFKCVCCLIPWLWMEPGSWQEFITHMCTEVTLVLLTSWVLYDTIIKK